MAVYKGPVRPGTDEQAFRQTGRSIPRTGGGGGRRASGPVRPGIDEEVFRETGRSLPLGSQEAIVIRGQIQQRARQAQQKAAEAAIKKRQEELRISEQQRLAEAEKRRIQQLKAKLLSQKAQKRARELFDSKTKQRVRIETIINPITKERIFTTTNLKTGEKSIRTFEQARRGGLTRETGGLIEPTQIQKERKEKIVSLNIENLTKKRFVELPKDVERMIKENKYSQSINNIRSTRQLNQSLQKDVQLGRKSELILEIADIISGGTITEKNINKDQNKLNERIIQFNNKYNGRELSEEQFKRAEAEQKYIELEQKKLDERTNNLVKSKRNTLNTFYQKFFVGLKGEKRLTIEQQKKVIEERNKNVKIQNEIKKNTPLINKKEKQIKKLNIERNKLEKIKKRNILQEITLFRKKNKLNNLQTEVARLKYELPPKILTGTMPIIPAVSIPKGITKIRFLGTQKVGKGGKIITDIAFKTKKGTSGIARGVSIIKKGKTTSIISGRFGKITTKLLSKAKKLKKVKTFIGVEKSISKTRDFTSEQIRKIGKFIQNQRKKGVIKVIKTNIKGMEQAGIGRVATVKGDKFFKSYIRFPTAKMGAKLARRIDIDDFASISAVLTKKDISRIIGKTITYKGRMAEFIGAIKSLKGSSSMVILSDSAKQQYSKALQKLFSSVSAAVSKAEQSGRFTTKSAILAAAANSLTKTIPSISQIKLEQTTIIPKKIISPKQAIVSKQRIKIKPKVLTKNQKQKIAYQKKVIVSKVKNLEKQITKQRQSIKQLAKSKTNQSRKIINKTKTAIKQAQKQLIKLKQAQKLITKQIKIIKITTPLPKIKPIKAIIPPLFKLNSRFKQKKLRKSQPTFYVVEKVRGKFKKLYPKPLVAKDAKDYAVYSIDNRLSKTAFFVPLGKHKIIVRPPKNIQGYYSKNKRKVRPYKIRFGKKKQMVRGFIEKRKFFQDTKGEKGQLMIVRRKAMKKKPIKRNTVKRKLTTQQRRLLLLRLKKARRVRMKNLRNRKV